MAVPKELLCMHCKKTIPFGNGFKHDNDLNLLCSHCNKPMFGVTEVAEEEINKVVSVLPNYNGVSGYYRKEVLPISMGGCNESLQETLPEEGTCFE